MTSMVQVAVIMGCSDEAADSGGSRVGLLGRQGGVAAGECRPCSGQQELEGVQGNGGVVRCQRADLRDGEECGAAWSLGHPECLFIQERAANRMVKNVFHLDTVYWSVQAENPVPYHGQRELPHFHHTSSVLSSPFIYDKSLTRQTPLYARSFGLISDSCL